MSIKSFISPTYVVQIEKGEYGISLLKFITICNSLQINPDHILKDFTIFSKENEVLEKYLQISKNMSRNIFDFMKFK